MESKEVEIKGKKYKLQELEYDVGEDILTIKDQKDRNRQLIKKSLVEPVLSEEEIKKLPLGVGLKLIVAITELNGFGETNFQ